MRSGRQKLYCCARHRGPSKIFQSAFLLRNGGSPKCCLGGRAPAPLRFKRPLQCLQPQGAVRKDRDAKVELNHRSQACEVLTGTGISRRGKWTGRQVTLPLDLAREASASPRSVHLRSPLCQREAISRTFRRAPIAANLDSMCFAFIRCDFWFQTEAHRTKFKIQLRRSDSDDPIWFVALAIEQLALVTDNRSHKISFR